jgi:hypothetical protein
MEVGTRDGTIVFLGMVMQRGREAGWVVDSLSRIFN